MDTLLYLFGSTVIAIIQMLPLRLVARLGRVGGWLFYWIDARHRKVAIRNLRLCFPEKTQAEAVAIAKENFKRIGENFASAVKTAAMTPEQLRPHFDFVGAEKILPHKMNDGPQSRIVAIGHFGNFELYARFGEYVHIFKCATTYRGLKQPSLNRLMQSLREKSGCRFFERRTESAALKACMSDTGLLLGLLADQRARGNLRVNFLGRDCVASSAPGIFALRYNCPLHTSICYRVGLAKWLIEVGDEIPTRVNGEPRSNQAITQDIHDAFEVAIRRDPANWFWVHDRWTARWEKAQQVEESTENE